MPLKTCMPSPPNRCRYLSLDQPPLHRNHTLTPRAETLPANFPKFALSGIPFASPADIATILDSENADVLLLDMRGSNQYARSRIRGALNLCVPTTLLKRPAYNTNWLAATFDSPEQRQKFEGMAKLPICHRL